VTKPFSERDLLDGLESLLPRERNDSLWLAIAEQGRCSMRVPRILLADDHTMFMEALRLLLEPEFEIVSTVANGRALLSECRRLKPDAVVLDLAMPLLGGLDAARQLKAEGNGAKLIFLTMNSDPEIAGEALRLGAAGFLLKTSTASELKTAIHEALQGRSYITPLITRDVVDSLSSQRKKPELTPRQREVLQLLAEGRSMKEAGALMNLAPRTVAFHKYRIMEQLRVRTSAELVRFAVRHGMVA
jgi:DNA-binding NarL/FixJ family response regulator